MMNEIWKPSVTVSAIVWREHPSLPNEKQFLMIEEETSEGVRINQPAGHLEPNESLDQAVMREALEETAHIFEPEGFVGTYLSQFYKPKRGNVTYLRFVFCGRAGKKLDMPLDKGILRAEWFTYHEIKALEHMHRSPLVLKCIEDFLAGQCAPLQINYAHSSVSQGINIPLVNAYRN